VNAKQQQRIYDALRCIARDYEKSDKLIAHAQERYGLDPIEALQMAYDNIQQTAKDALKGIRNPGAALADF
jgi:hypothetical protein